jgi:HPt (histidine-containing phosphotransfer) domain-containing protein
LKADVLQVSAALTQYAKALVAYRITSGPPTATPTEVLQASAVSAQCPHTVIADDVAVPYNIILSLSICENDLLQICASLAQSPKALVADTPTSCQMYVLQVSASRAQRAKALVADLLAEAQADSTQIWATRAQGQNALVADLRAKFQVHVLDF